MKGLQADATTWVFKRGDGEMEAVKVAAMGDAHLFRWIRYFRKKWRDNGHVGTDAEVDVLIKLAIVTAPAIYAEAAKRGVYVVSPAATVSFAPDAGAAPAALVPGARRIDLNEE